jgi:Tfp pilus assembly protein PilF
VATVLEGSVRTAGDRLRITVQLVNVVGAREMFERAIGRDEAHAPAHAGLADAHSWLYEWWGGTADDLEAADRASRRALELAQDLAEAHASRGFVLSLTGRYEESQAAFERARAPLMPPGCRLSTC